MWVLSTGSPCSVSHLRAYLLVELPPWVMSDDVADEGHMQILVPYGLYRTVLAWIRRTHRTLTVDEFIAEATEERLRVVDSEWRMRTA